VRLYLRNIFPVVFFVSHIHTATLLSVLNLVLFYFYSDRERERERERERKLGVVVRDTTIEGGVGNNNFRFEGSQALPASPTDKGEA
jgi:hypothetical protein